MLVILLLSADAFAQDREISATAGVGHVDGEDANDQWFSMLGLSFSARLWRPEIKIDYEHLDWDRTGNLHVIGVGWLIQKRATKLRPFFQWGILGGVQRQRFSGTIGRPDFAPLSVERTFTNAFTGVALSTGFTADVRKQFFIRPEVRWKIIGPGPFMVTVPTVSAGYRF